MPRLSSLGNKQRSLCKHTILAPALVGRPSPAASTGRLDAHSLAVLDAGTVFGTELLLRTVSANDGSAPGSAIIAAIQSPGPLLAAIGKDRHIAIGEHFYFADYAVAAGEPSASTRASA